MASWRGDPEAQGISLSLSGGKAGTCMPQPYEKCHWLTGHLLLEVQGVGKNLPHEHIEGTKENPMTTYSKFQALLVCFS